MMNNPKSITVKDLMHARYIELSNVKFVLQRALRLLDEPYDLENIDIIQKCLATASDGVSKSKAYANIQYSVERDPSGNNEDYKYD